ncbi:ABC transporter ATP-binding protein, partial [Verrucomicrobiota bacterium]
MTDQTEDRAAFLKRPLPEAVLALVEEHVGKEPELLVAMPADMLPSGDYGESWLAVGKERLGAVCLKDETPELISLHDVKDLDSVTITAGVGNSVLQAKKNGTVHRVIRFSNARRAEFSQAAGLIDKWVKESEWDSDSVNIKRSLCPRCQRPIPKGMDICQACLDKGKLLRRSLSYVQPYRGLVLAVILLMTLSSVLALLPPFLGRYMVDKVITPLQNSHLILPLALAMLATYVTQCIVEGATRLLSAKTGTRAIYDVRGSMFAKLQEMSLSFYAKKQTGGLITRVNQDTNQLHTLLVEFIPFGVNMVLMTVGILGLLLYLSWFLTLCVLVPIVTMVLFIRRVFPKFHLFWGRFFEKRSRLSAYVTDVITGVRVVKAFAQEPSEITRFNEKSGDLRDAQFNAAKKMAQTMPILQALAMSGSPIVWLVGGWMVFDGKMTLGDIIAYSGLVMMLFRPIFILSRLAELIPHSLAAAARVFDIIDAEPEIADAPDARPMPDVDGLIELKEVSFGYEPHKRVLHDVSAKIAPREMIGLVGHSGAGKTTIVNLICRFYDADDGQILIDGVNVRDIRYNDLRRLMGVVPQETFLLNGTIADNIAYAK